MRARSVTDTPQLSSGGRSRGSGAPALELDAQSRALLVRLRDAGVLAPDVDIDRAYRTWTALVGGVISQQLSNAPGETFETGAFTAVLPDVMDMWLSHHRSNPPAR